MDPLAADKEVERAITACCRPKCYPDVNASIILLGAALGSDPSSGRERVLFAQLRRTVDVALHSYRSELIARGDDLSSWCCLHFSADLRRFGRAHTESRLLTLHRLLRRVRSPGSATKSGEMSEDLIEALETIDALRSLVNIVMTLRPKATFVRGVNLRVYHWNPVCRFCSKPTELQAFRDGLTFREGAARTTLSPTLCCEHLARRVDGRNSSEYRKWLRNEAVLKHELKELTWASVRKGARESSWESRMLYAFRRMVVDRKDLYLDDEVELANEARALVTHGMTDRKKILAVLNSMGADARSIGERLGVSKAAVYKAIASLPDAYKPVAASEFLEYSKG